MIHWAQRIEHANLYLQQEILPKFEGKITAAAPDTLLALLAIYDQSGSVSQPSEARLADELAGIGKARLGAKVDSMIYNVRKNAKVAFLQDEFKDERNGNPATLLAKADSLRDAASDAEYDGERSLLDDAENAYRILMNDFAFAYEGRKAMSELAKILIDKYNSGPRPERYLLSTAINAYRRAQILDIDDESLCNNYFMTGFTYDEYMKNYPLAEANYKWILRFAPTCGLASDAEFMLQHLGEPMTSIEEIQGQSVRQGRKVDFDDEIAVDDDDDDIAAAAKNGPAPMPVVETL
jgi:hypothetical protein